MGERKAFFEVDIKTREDFIEFFSGADDPYIHPQDAVRLIDGILDKPSPWGKTMSIRDCVSLTWNNYLMFRDARFGWVDRDGKLWGCSYAAHERLLNVMGLGEAWKVEGDGWLRVGLNRIKSVFQINEKQAATLEDMGHKVPWEEQRALPVYTGEPVKAPWERAR